MTRDEISENLDQIGEAIRGVLHPELGFVLVVVPHAGGKVALQSNMPKDAAHNLLRHVNNTPSEDDSPVVVAASQASN
jgi:hypothetical protein